MTELISSVITVPVVLALCAIFIIMLVVVHKTITDMSFFGDTSGWIVAACVAALSVIGLLQFFGAPSQATHAASEPRTGDGVLNFVLFPYVVLLVCVLLVLALRMVWPAAKPRHPDEVGRNLAVEDKRRVRKGTDDRATVSTLRRPEKEQTADHRIKNMKEDVNEKPECR